MPSSSEDTANQIKREYGEDAVLYISSGIIYLSRRAFPIGQPFPEPSGYQLIVPYFAWHPPYLVPIHVTQET